MSKKYLYYFSEGNDAFGGDKVTMKNTLGGKGAGLAEMTACLLYTSDITAQLNGTGRNSLWVAVQDPTGHGTQARGKQTLQPGGMFYPAQSGIWQTVWLERVPENYIQSLTVTPDYDARTVTVKVHTSAPGGAVNLWAVVRAGGVTIAEDWGSDEADQDGTVCLLYTSRWRSTPTPGCGCTLWATSLRASTSWRRAI